jgi:hypothetical protein
LLDDPEAAVVWRGPMVSGAIRQFYTDMNWGDLDYLLVDLPPGTSDAPMTVMQQLPTDGAVLVSTPQGLATMVVSKAIQMVKKFEVPIVGVVENMSYVELPDGTSYELFGPSKGQRLVALSGAPLLGRLPIDPQIALLSDEGRIEEYDSEPYRTLAANFLTRLEQRAEARPALPVISSRSLAGVARNVHGGASPSDVGAVAARRDPHDGGEQSPAASPQTASAHPVAQPSVEPAQNGGGERGAKLLRLNRFLKHGK